MTTHVKGKHHIEMAAASSSSMSMAPFCRPQTSLKFIEAETLWSKFIAMHNIPSVGAYALIISMSFPLPIYLMCQKIEFFIIIFYYYSDFTKLASTMQCSLEAAAFKLAPWTAVISRKQVQV